MLAGCRWGVVSSNIYAQRARARCAARVVEACIESVRVRASARKVYSDLATVKSKLEALELDAAREARAIASAAGSATRGRCRAALVPGQESQAELTRCEKEPPTHWREK